MKISNDYELRLLAGEYVVMPIGQALLDGKKPVIINETSAMIYREIATQSFDIDKYICSLKQEYDVSESVLRKDLSNIIHQLLTKNIIIE